MVRPRPRTVYSRVTGKPGKAAHHNILSLQFHFSYFSSRKPNIFLHDLRAGSCSIATKAPRAHAGMMEASGTTFLSVRTT